MLHRKSKQKIFLGTLFSCVAFFVFSADQAQAYTYSASAISPVKSYASFVKFNTISWTAVASTGAYAITMDVRAGDTATPDNTWTDGGNWTNLTGLTFTTSTSGVITNDISALGAKKNIQYRINFAYNDVSSMPGVSDVTISTYSGELISSVYDTQNSGNKLTTLSWNESIAGSSDVQLQVRTSANNSTWTSWCGPDNAGAGCSSSTWFGNKSGGDVMDADFTDGASDRYIQYKIGFFGDGTNAPSVQDVTLGYDRALTMNATAVSPVKDTGQMSTFSTMTWTQTPATNTADVAVYMYVRAGNTPTSDSSWTNGGAWTMVAKTGDSLAAFSGNRYIQYQINLESTSANTTIVPMADAVTIPYSYYPVSNRPALLMHLNGTAGNVANGAVVSDSSGNGNNGMTVNANGTGMSYVAQAGNMAGLSQAMTFDGVDDYVNIPASSSLNIGAPVTTEAWIKTNALGATTQRIFANLSGYGIRLYSSGFINLGGFGCGNKTGTIPIVAGNWYHIVGINDGVNTSLYVNGVPDFTGAYVGVCTGSNPSQIGALWNGSIYTDFFNGQIDEVAVYNRALSAAEIAAHYAAGVPSETQPPSNVLKILSSPYNSQDPTNALAKINWNETLPAGTDVKFQLRTAPDNAGAPNWAAGSGWCGPGIDSTTCAATKSDTDYAISAFYTNPAVQDTNLINRTGGNDQWMQYIAWLENNTSMVTPTLSDVTLTYVVNVPPLFDTTYGTNGVNVAQVNVTDVADTANLGKVKIDYKIKDTDTAGGSFTANYVTPTFDYTLDNGTTWTAVDPSKISFGAAPSGGEVVDCNLANNNCSLSADGKMDNKVLEGSYLTYTAYWDANSQLGDVYSPQFKIRVNVNDNEVANNTATVTAAPANASLDVKDPTLNTSTLKINDSSSTVQATTSAITLKLQNIAGDTATEMIYPQFSMDNGSTWYGANGDNSWNVAANWGTGFTLNNLGSRVWNRTMTARSETIKVRIRDYYGNEQVTQDSNVVGFNAVPEVQIVSAAQGEDGFVGVTYKARDTDTDPTAVTPNTTGGVTPNKLEVTLQYCTANCTTSGSETWANANTFSGSNNDVGANVAVTSAAFASQPDKSIVWNVKADYNNQYNGNFKIRIKADDKEPIYNVVNVNSGNFILDTKNPANVSFHIDHNNNQLISTTPTDNSTFQMSISNTAGTFATFENFVTPYLAYSPSVYASIPADPATVYIRIKDVKGNYTDVSATTPVNPTNPSFFDTSSTSQQVWQEFISWDKAPVDQVGSGFGAYKVYRNKNGGAYVWLKDVTDRNTNYYVDRIKDPSGTENSDPSFDPNSPATYGYKVMTVDTNVDSSVYSDEIFNSPTGSFVSNPNVGIIDLAVPAEKVFTSQVTINWNTVMDATTAALKSNAKVELRKNVVGEEWFVAVNLPNEFSSTHSVTTANNLEANTEYEYRVSSETPWGKVAVQTGTDPATFTTKNGPTIEDVGLDLDFVGNSSVVIIWNTLTAKSSAIPKGVAANSLGKVFYATTINGSGDLVNPTEVSCGTEMVSEHICSIDNLDSATTYYYYVYSAYDLSGNQNAYNVDTNTGLYYSFKPKKDETAPVITVPEAPATVNPVILTDQQAAFAMTTNEKTKSWVIYGTTSHPAALSPIETGTGLPDATRDLYGAYATDSSSISTSHALTVNSLPVNTKHYYRLVAEDISGNVSFTEEKDFTTKPVQSGHISLKSITPAADLTIAQMSSDGAIVTYNAGTETKSRLCYSTSAISDSDLTNEAGVCATNKDVDNEALKLHSHKITGLTNSTLYYFRIIVEDSVDSTDKYKTASGLTNSGTTLAAAIVFPDLTEPGNLNILDVSASTILAQIDAETNTYANSILCYGADEIEVDTRIASVDLAHCETVSASKAHYYYLTGLNSDTPYFLKAKITDNNNNAIVYYRTPVVNPVATAVSTAPHIALASTPTNPKIITVAQKSDQAAVVILNAETEATSRLCYSLNAISDTELQNQTGDCATNVDVINTATRIHYYKLGSPALTADTTYHVRIKLIDSVDVNDTQESAEQIFTTLAASFASTHTPLSTIPKQTINPSQVSDQSAVLTVDAGTEATSKICLIADTADTSVIADGNVSTCTGGIKDQITNATKIQYYKFDNNLNANTKYHAKIEFTDAINLSDIQYSNELVFSTLKKQIEHKPLSENVPSGVPSVEQKSGTEAIITFNAGTNVDSELCYRESTGTGDLGEIADNFSNCIGTNQTLLDTTLHAYHIAGLAPGVKYFMEMKLIDTQDVVSEGTYTMNTGTGNFITTAIALEHLTSVSLIEVKQVSDTEAVAYVTADVDATAKLCYSTTTIDNAALTTCVAGSSNDGNGGVFANLGVPSKVQMFHLTGLDPSKTYFVRAKVTNNSIPGENLNSDNASFTTEAVLISVTQLTNPGLLDVLNVSATTIVAKLPTANTYATSRLCYNENSAVLDGDIDAGTGTCAKHVDVSVASKNHIYYVTDGIVPDTTYYLKAKITDATPEYSATSFIDVPNPLFLKTDLAPMSHTALGSVDKDLIKTIAISNKTDHEAIASVDAKTEVTSEVCYVQDDDAVLMNKISDVSSCVGGVHKVLSNNNNWQYYNADGLVENKRYHIKMKFVDSVDVNDFFETDETSFVTLPTQLAHAPLSTIKNAGNVGLPEIMQVSGTAATISYNAGTNVDSELCYREQDANDSNDLNIINTFASANCIGTNQTIADAAIHPYHLSGLTKGKTYLVEIKLTDTHDVAGATFSINTGTQVINTPADPMPNLTTVSDISIKNFSDTEAVAYLTADVDVNAQVCYSTDHIDNAALATCIVGSNNSNIGTFSGIVGNSKMITFHLTGLSPLTSYYLRAKVTNAVDSDEFLNSTESDSFTTKQVQTTHTPLNLVAGNPSFDITLLDDAVSIAVDAGTASDSKLCYSASAGINMTDCVAVTPQVSNSKIHSYVIPNLEADTTYYVKMKLTDAVDSSDQLVVAEIPFKTLPIQITHIPLSKIEADGLLPATPTVAMVSGTAAVVTYDSKTNVQSELCYKDFANGEVNGGSCTWEAVPAVLNSTLHSYTLDATNGSELTPGHTYHALLRLTDFNDVGGSTKVIITGIASFTTPIVNPPVINNPGDPELVQVSDTEAILKLSTDADATSKLCYGKTPILDADVNNNTCVKFELVSVATKDHFYHLTNLDPETEYHVKSKIVNVEDNNNFFVSSGNLIVDSVAAEFFTTKKAQTDATGPLTTITTPGVSDMTIGYDYAVINWLTDQPATQTLNCGVESGIYTETATDASLNILHALKIGGLNSDTLYHCVATSSDAAGNITKVSQEFTFTTTKDTTIAHPAISSISDIVIPTELISDGHAVVTFKTDQASICYAKMTTSQGIYSNAVVAYEDGYDSAKYNLSHSISFVDLIPTSSYYFNLYCHDDLFNADSNASLEISSNKESSFKTLGKLGPIGNTDTIKPEISGVKSSAITGESVLISWTTNEKASSSVRFGTLTIDESMAGNSFVNKDVLNYVTAHEVLVNNLVPATKYVFAVSSSDVAGNMSSSTQDSFTTDSPSALSSIKVTSTAIDRATITWTTANPTSSIVEYGITNEYGQIKSDNLLVKEHSISLSDLDSTKEYHFRVKGKDKLGNIYASSDYTFEPKSPPKIENVKVEKITEHGATITFKTSVATDSLVVFTNVKDEKDTGSQGDPDMKNDHAVELKNLEPGATFKIRVKVRDVDGNEAEEIGKEFTVGKDTTAPKIDQVKTDSALAQNDKVQTIISWTTDEPSTTAIIYQEGKGGDKKEVKINNSLTTSHVAVITTFKSGVVYYFNVKSVDQSNNESVSNDFALLTPRKKENIIQIIVGNFQDIFGWIKMN